MSGRPAVAVVGATGVVGSEMLRILTERAFPVGSLRLFASPRSEGREIEWGGETHVVRTLGPGCFDGCDLVLMEVESPLSKEWAPVAVQAGAFVVDNSSAWRMDDAVPLVVAEVNPDALDALSGPGIVANPNCTTMGIMPVVKPLHDAAGLERMVVTTLQAVSGSGKAGIAGLQDETRAFIDDGDLERLRRSGVDGVAQRQDVYPRAIALNVVPQCDDFAGGDAAGTGETKEERKLVDESRKILGDPALRVAATCVRVPVVAGHSAAVNVEFRAPMTAALAAELLTDAPGVEFCGGATGYRTPLEVAGVDGSWVGRLRDDDTRPNTLDMFVVTDNLRKGAALNCVQIAEELVARGRI